ncbi:MAG: lysylphosphatidylglycerol synthase transmembrane domain-containing protein, partial [bacterium]
MSKRILKIVFFILILLGIALLLKDVDFKQTLPVLKNMNYALLVGVFFLSAVNIFLFAVRWYILLKATKDNISFKNVFLATIGGIAINSSGPGKLGVPAKAIFIKKMEGLEFNKSIPSLMMELVFEISSLWLLFVISASAIGLHSILLNFISELFA